MDDHAGIRQGLRVVLSTEPNWLVVAEAADGEQRLTLVLQERPDALILDLQLPRLGGLAVPARIQEQASLTRVVIFSLSGKAHTVVAAHRAGAAASVLKGAEPTELVHALRRALAGERYLCQALCAHTPTW